MKIRMTVLSVKDKYEFDETYDIPNNSDPEKWATDLINLFNSTLNPGESPRKLIKVVVLEETSKVRSDHNWEKQNLVTIVRGSGSYDIMKCSKCGITAKRWGLGNIVRDSRYKAKVYDTCEGAISQLKKLAEKRKLSK